MSLLMLVVVILFAPTLLGFALLASRLEARFLDPPGTVPGTVPGMAGAVVAPARPARLPARRPTATPRGPNQV